jgi:ABC-type sugar transport system substrate-binding protein
MDSRGLQDKAYKLVLDFLKEHLKVKGILISVHNDTVTLGALRAVRALKQESLPRPFRTQKRQLHALRSEIS